MDVKVPAHVVTKLEAPSRTVMTRAAGSSRMMWAIAADPKFRRKRRASADGSFGAKSDGSRRAPHVTIVPQAPAGHPPHVPPVRGSFQSREGTRLLGDGA